VLIADEHGPVAVYGIPYLEPDVLHREWDLPKRSHHAALAEAMRRIRADLAGRPPRTRSVVLAHAFVAGGLPSESERDIAVGGISIVPLELFDGIDYTALGHLHGRATLTDSIRYSGSPVAYSFSEAGHVKGSWLVDLDAGGLGDVRFVPAPVTRPLACLTGTIESLLTDPGLSVHEGSWVQATLTDATRPVRAMERLRVRFPHALALRFAPIGGEDAGPRPAAPGRSAHDIALEFVSHVRGTPATPAESKLLQTALECCTDDPDLVVQQDAWVSS
jgi:exonuclease SbcD